MKYRFWIDTETSGINPELNQILEYAVIVEDSKGNKVEQLETKIKLRPFVRPSPEALAANNIDPFSEDWISAAISEEKAAEQLADLCEKYTVGGVKPVFTAYNAEFDIKHIKLMFLRHGIIFDQCFSPAVFDPLKSVKELVKSGQIKTRKITKGRKTYSSSKLEDVAAALNVTTGKPAHRALNDVETLILVTRAVYTLITGKSLYEGHCDPRMYKEGDTLHLVTDSAGSGIKKRHVKVLKNNLDVEQFIAFDLSDYARIGLAPSNIRTFNYYTVVDELSIEEESLNKLENLVSSNQDFIKSKLS